jgi:hypothetical protein
LHRPKYVVLSSGSAWRIRSASRRCAETYASKRQALCAAIEFAEADGRQGHRAEVLVRHEDERIILEWTYGQNVHHDVHPDDAARPHPARAERR